MQIGGRNNSNPELDEILKKIERYGCDETYLVLHYGKVLTRKEIKYDTIYNCKLNDTIRELETVKQLNQRNLVEVVDYFINTENNVIYIYIKYHGRGDLWKLIEDSDDFSIEVHFF